MSSYLSSLPFIPIVAVLVALALRRNRPPLPPGPKGLPLVGNLRDIAAASQDLSWVRYSKWSKVYGDIYHLSVLGRHIIVLSSQKTINDLLNKRSDNYSDRPDMPMCMGLMQTDWFFGFFRYSDWAFHQRFQPRVMPEYYDIQRTATASLLEKLANSPEHFIDHIRYHAGSIILKISYGYTLQTTDASDPYLRLVFNAMEGINEATNFGSFWIDYFPILKYVPAWFPGAGFKRKAEKWKQYGRDLTDQPWGWVKQAMEDGTAAPSFCTQSAEYWGVTPGEDSEMEAVIKNCAAISYVGGAESLVSSMLSFVLAMALHPEFQTRAQQEIDSAVGTGRLPDFDDRERLPFVDALLAETLRWNPVAPSGGPAHRAVHDDVYEGYFIPAGVTIVPNLWEVLHDEGVYGPRPMEFDPYRFMKQDGNNPPSPEQYVFGFGRRICPGRYLALNSTFLAITYLLATFTIAKALDEDGNEIIPDVEYTDGLVSNPKPFKCRFIPRKPGVSHGNS